MKSVLYVAATVMIGASIYGFVDYSKTSKHKEFKTMYEENDIKTSPAAEGKKQTDIAVPETISKKEVIEVNSEEPFKKPADKIKKRRTIDLKSFSRAPLREKKEIVLPAAKEKER
jgi:hypothetical protein